ncbi:MAG: glycoside hydrolase family 3 protein [Clostridiales bacterium]|nr:glycoside hydrolase family 3 protein [Clostridiales bacterium]
MDSFEKQARELVSKMTLAERCSQLLHNAPAIERLGVPAYNWWNEALHGVARSGVATVFPQSIAMAASFDDALLYRVAQAISDEARAKYNEYKRFGSTQIYQGLTFWSPNINIFRDPRWGRGHETYGEDPYLTGRMGAAFVRGLQGDPKAKYKKLDATLKHYAVHSGPESQRHSFDAVVSKQDLYETYLPAFKYCIEKASPSAVMGAYNRTNGEPCCASPTLIGEILYKQFKFKGYFLSDCGAINDIHENHHVTNTQAESAALAINNGCVLNCGSAYGALMAAYEAGLVSEETITEAAVKLFTARFRLGMFAPEGDCEYDKIPYDVVDCKKHRKLNAKMARESIVLLKNNGILPLENKKDLKIAVIGPNAKEVSVLLGNYNGTPYEFTTIFEGIKNQAKGKVYYAAGSRHMRGDMGDWDEHLLRDALLAADRSDVVIMCMGLTPNYEGEEGSFGNGGDKRDIELPAAQQNLFREVLARGKPIIFVNVSGSAMNLTEQDEKCDAVIQLFYCGSDGGNALADVIFGRVNPSGRLPVTFYRSTEDLPPFEDYSMDNRTYKFFRGKPLYPFGYGLSYTTFKYSNLTVKPKKHGADFTIDVTNTGSRVGDEVVLLYNHKRNADVRVPIKKLIAFKRVSLKPGETKTVQLKTEKDAFYHVNEDGKWIFTEGEFDVMCGDIAEVIYVK